MPLRKECRIHPNCRRWYFFHWSIPTLTEGGIGHVRHHAWQDKLVHILHHKYFHFLVLSLLVLDLLLVITSIALEIEHLTSEINQCEQILELCVHGESAVHGRRSAAEATCAIPEHFGNQTLKDVEEVLAIISMTILSFFLLENILLIIGVGPRHFFTNAFYVLDLVVITVSLALEIVFQNNPEGGLLIIARMWRFIRIAHGFVETTKSEAEEHLAKAILAMDNELTDLRPLVDDVRSGNTSTDETIRRLAAENPTLLLKMMAVAQDFLEENKDASLTIEMEKLEDKLGLHGRKKKQEPTVKSDGETGAAESCMTVTETSSRGQSETSSQLTNAAIS